MVIVLEPKATRKEIEYVLRRASSLGLRTHVSEQHGCVVVGLLGDLRGISAGALETLPGVREVCEMTRPFPLASRELRPAPSVVRIGDCEIGGRRLVVMAGPCSVETPVQMRRAAAAVKQAGAVFLRGGAFKPRSSPYSFRGLAEEGLKILADAAGEMGLLTVSEVLSPDHVELVGKYVDLLQVGARNMQNFPLLDAIGESRLPVLLKRGMMCTLEELLLSAEYVLSHGNSNVVLCERGIRTFETYTRNTLDIAAIPALRELTHLPVIADPSHATGRASLVRAVSRAAVAAGADGLLIEVHPNPTEAWSDGHQSVATGDFSDLMVDVRAVAGAIDRGV